MNVFQLTSDEEGNSEVRRLSENLFGRDTNRILQEFMNSLDRDEVVKRKLESLFDLLMNGDLDTANTLLVELTNEIGTQDPELVRAASILHRKRTIGR